MVCQQIFQGGLQNAYHGLLHSPPYYIKEELQEILTECTNPEPSNLPKYKMLRTTFHRLYNLLSNHLYKDLLKITTIRDSNI